MGGNVTIAQSAPDVVDRVDCCRCLDRSFWGLRWSCLRWLRRCLCSDRVRVALTESSLVVARMVTGSLMMSVWLLVFEVEGSVRWDSTVDGLSADIITVTVTVLWVNPRRVWSRRCRSWKLNRDSGVSN